MAEPQEKPEVEEKPKAEKPEQKTPDLNVVTHIVTPVLAKDFKLTIHGHREHDAIVPAGTTKKDLTNKKLWNHVSPKIVMHDEIRVIEENGAFMAKLFVTFKHNLDVVVKILEFYELDDVDYEAATGLDAYEVKNRGAVGWCVVDKESGKNLFTGLEDQAAAIKKRDEYAAKVG